MPHFRGLAAALLLLPFGAAADGHLTELQEEIVTQCVANLGIGPDTCTCLAESGADQLSEPGQRMLLAMVQNDPDAVALASQSAPMADQIAAPLMMVGGLQACLLGGVGGSVATGLAPTTPAPPPPQPPAAPVGAAAADGSVAGAAISAGEGAVESK